MKGLTRNFSSRGIYLTQEGILWIKLYKDRVNRDVLKFSFANRVIEQWNKLPETMVNVNSVNTFKNKLDKFLKAKEWNWWV